jgi:wyosine [tRNA(Phe)-imidazoG37] synthetase (radical SAM superfamily)
VDQTCITIQKDLIRELQKLLRDVPAPDRFVISGKGDPGICKRLGAFIGNLKSITNAPVVVVSCGGLFWKSDVQNELSAADVVVASLDAPDKTLFQCINRPIGLVPFARFLSGIMEFRSFFKGEFILRVTLLDGINAIEAEVKKLAELANQLGPTKILIQTAGKTPVEDFAFIVDRARLEYFAGFFKDIKTDVIEANAL